MTRDLVYGRRPVREALRGPREVLELWASENALKSEEWLRELDKPRVQTKLERDLSEAAGTRDHQGVVAWSEPFRYADAFALASGELRCSRVSTRSATRATSAPCSAARRAQAPAEWS